MKIISSNIKKARTLNGSFYNSKEYLKKCSIYVFEKTWQLLSDDSELKNPILKSQLIPRSINIRTFISFEKDSSINVFQMYVHTEQIY